MSVGASPRRPKAWRPLARRAAGATQGAAEARRTGRDQGCWPAPGRFTPRLAGSAVPSNDTLASPNVACALTGNGPGAALVSCAQSPSVAFTVTAVPASWAAAVRCAGPAPRSSVARGSPASTVRPVTPSRQVTWPSHDIQPIQHGRGVRAARCGCRPGRRWMGAVEPPVAAAIGIRLEQDVRVDQGDAGDLQAMRQQRQQLDLGLHPRHGRHRRTGAAPACWQRTRPLPATPVTGPTQYAPVPPASVGGQSCDTRRQRCAAFGYWDQSSAPRPPAPPASTTTKAATPTNQRLILGHLLPRAPSQRSPGLLRVPLTPRHRRSGRRLETECVKALAHMRRQRCGDGQSAARRMRAGSARGRADAAGPPAPPRSCRQCRYRAARRISRHPRSACRGSRNAPRNWWVRPVSGCSSSQASLRPAVSSVR